MLGVSDGHTGGSEAAALSCEIAHEVRDMTDVLKTPEPANDGARSALGLDLVPHVLDRAVKLTKSWGAFRAFVCVTTIVVVLGISFVPKRHHTSPECI